MKRGQFGTAMKRGEFGTAMKKGQFGTAMKKGQFGTAVYSPTQRPEGAQTNSSYYFNCNVGSPPIRLY